MAANRNGTIEVRPAGPGSGWLLDRQGDAAVISRHRTQREAIEEGKALAKLEQIELVVKGRDGRVRSRSSYDSVLTLERTDVDMATTDAQLHRGVPGVPDRRTHSRERVNYVVASERQILLRASGLARESRRRVPDGIRHAVKVTSGDASCGVAASSLFVFGNLNWTTMLSNDMCPACKRSAF